MQTLLRASLVPWLFAVGAFVACSSDSQGDDDDGGEAGSETGGKGNGGRAGRNGSGGTAGASVSDAGSGATSGTSSSTGGGGDVGGSANGGESGADNAGTGAEAGDSNGSGGSGTGATGGDSPGGMGGSSNAGTGGSAGSDGGAGTGGGSGAGGTSGAGGSGGAACSAIAIESLSHHLGDDTGAEGTTLSRSFELGCTCASPWLSLQLDGPNRETPPHVYVNGSELPSLQGQFPAVTADEIWQTSGSNHDYNGYLQIHYDLGTRLVSGTNTFTITNGKTSDDYNVKDVRLECGAYTTPKGPDIVNRANWVGYYDDRSGDDPAGIQGAFYAYSDGVSCSVPSSLCGTGACCLSGTTLASEPSTNWGCGMGLQLKSSGGETPVESAYTGPANCFELELTGNSGGNDVRMQAATDVDMSEKTAPVHSLGAISGTTRKTVCFSDFACPASPSKPCAITGSWYRLELNVVGGVSAAAFNVCMQSLVPYAD